MDRRETEPSSQSTAIERVEQRAPTAFQERPSLNDALRYHQDFQSVSCQDASSSAGPQTALLEERRGTKRRAEEVGLTASSTAPEAVLKSLRMRAAYLFEMGAFAPEAREKNQAAIKAAMKRPEVKEKHQAAMKRPEVKEKCRAALKETLAKQKEAGIGRYAPQVPRHAQ